MKVFPEWRHGTAQGLQEHKSRAARARHEVTSDSLTYKFIVSYVSVSVSVVSAFTSPVHVANSHYTHWRTTSQLLSSAANLELGGADTAIVERKQYLPLPLPLPRPTVLFILSPAFGADSWVDDQAVISAGDSPESPIRKVCKGQASDRHGQGEQREPRHHVESAIVHVSVGLPERGRQFTGVGAFGQVGLRLPAGQGSARGGGDQSMALEIPVLHCQKRRCPMQKSHRLGGNNWYSIWSAYGHPWYNLSQRNASIRTLSYHPDTYF